jgi:hypothetical protein
MSLFSNLATRRLGVESAVVLLASVVGVLGAAESPAQASFGPGVSCSGTGQFPDFDPGFGGSDCVIAVPDRVVGGVSRGGTVEVYQTNAGHVVLTRASIGQGPPQAGDRFGAAIAYGNFDGDAYDDLVIGAPGVAGGAGRVYIVFGSAGGLGHGRATRVLAAGAGREYGASLATSRVYLSDFSIRERLLVGAPATKVKDQAGAGAVYRYSVRYRSAEHGQIIAELVAEKRLTEAVFATTGPARINERFGAAVATTSCGDYIGAPGEVVGTKTGAGAIVIVSGTEAVRWTQNTAHMAGTAEAGDAFGAAFSVRLNPSLVAVGAPGEDVGAKRDAGSVTVITPKKCPPTSSFTSRGFVQGTVAHSGAAEAGDRYGASVTWFTGSLDSALVAVGAPGEDIGAVKDAGAIVRLGLDLNSCPAGKRICARVWTQSSGEYTGTVRQGNRFGTTIGLVETDDGSVGTVVGAPGSAGGRGELSTQRSLSTFDPSWFQRQPGDHLGNVSPIG